MKTRSLVVAVVSFGSVVVVACGSDPDFRSRMDGPAPRQGADPSVSTGADAAGASDANRGSDAGVVANGSGGSASGAVGSASGTPASGADAASSIAFDCDVHLEVDQLK